MPQGQVRALVSKVFKANGSKFEVHTPSAVAAARGTYFTVWIENGQSGIINIGEKGRVDFTSGGITVAVDPGYFSIAHEGQAPSAPLPHQLGPKGHDPKVNDQSEATVRTAEKKTTSTHVLIHDQGPKVIHPLEKAELTLASSSAGLTRALAAVERTTLREALLVELPAQTLKAMNLDAHLLKALTTLTGLSIESRSGNIGGTAIVATGTLTTGALAVGSVSVGTTTVAPLAPVISTVVAPVAPVISAVVAPVVPLITTITTTPPAVINGALSLLK